MVRRYRIGRTIATAPTFSRLGKAYLVGIIGLGFLAIVESLLQLYRTPRVQGVAVDLPAIPTLISGSATSRVAAGQRLDFISSIFHRSCCTACRWHSTIALDGLASFWYRGEARASSSAFQHSRPALSAWYSAQSFFGSRNQRRCRRNQRRSIRSFRR